jgi:hypothetical protein
LRFDFYWGLDDQFYRPYIFGILNGIASIPDQPSRKKISDAYQQWNKKKINDGYSQNLIFKDIQQLYANWKPVNTYKEALAFANSTLKKQRKDSMFSEDILIATRDIIDYALTTVTLGGAGYGLYRLYNYFKK